MKIKVINNEQAVGVAGTILYRNKEKNISDKKINDIKSVIDKGYDILVQYNNKWVDAEKYFKEKRNSKTQVANVKAEIDEIASEPKEDNNNKNNIDYHYYFNNDLHWMKQVKRIRETEDYELVKELYNYAKNNNVLDSVVDRIKNHLDELS